MDLHYDLFVMDELGRYAGLTIGILATAIIALTFAPGGRLARQGTILLLAAFVIFVAVDIVSGHAITNARSPMLGAIGLLIVMAVVLIDLIVLTRRLRRPR